MQCAAINRMDLVQSKGGYPVPAGASHVLGVEVSGTVAAIGESCQMGLKLNEKVAALIPGGGYAEFCVVDERTVIRPLTDSLSNEVLASIPEAFMTAYQLCFVVGKLQPGESVLLHAAASSVGQAAIQMLVRKGMKVFCTTRSEDKRLKCLELGATGAFNASDGTFAEAVRAANGGRGVQMILDPVGAGYMDENLRALDLDGRLLIYGLMGGAGITDPTFLGKLMAKRITILTSTLRSRSVEYKAELLRLLAEDPDGFPAIAAGHIAVDVDRTFLLEEILEAHAYVGANKNTGKVVLLVANAASAIQTFEQELSEMKKRNNI